MVHRVPATNLKPRSDPCANRLVPAALGALGHCWAVLVGNQQPVPASALRGCWGPAVGFKIGTISCLRQLDWGVGRFWKQANQMQRYPATLNVTQSYYYFGRTGAFLTHIVQKWARCMLTSVLFHLQRGMGALGNGRRGGRSPPLLIGALIACILVLGFNYWVSSSRNLELQVGQDPLKKNNNSPLFDFSA